MLLYWCVLLINLLSIAKSYTPLGASVINPSWIWGQRVAPEKADPFKPFHRKDHPQSPKSFKETSIIFPEKLDRLIGKNLEFLKTTSPVNSGLSYTSYEPIKDSIKDSKRVKINRNFKFHVDQPKRPFLPFSSLGGRAGPLKKTVQNLRNLQNQPFGDGTIKSRTTKDTLELSYDKIFKDEGFESFKSGFEGGFTSLATHLQNTQKAHPQDPSIKARSALGNLDPDEVYYADDDLLIIKGGGFSPVYEEPSQDIRITLKDSAAKTEPKKPNYEPSYGINGIPSPFDVSPPSPSEEYNGNIPTIVGAPQVRPFPNTDLYTISPTGDTSPSDYSPYALFFPADVFGSESRRQYAYRQPSWSFVNTRSPMKRKSYKTPTYSYSPFNKYNKQYYYITKPSRLSHKQWPFYQTTSFPFNNYQQYPFNTLYDLQYQTTKLDLNVQNSIENMLNVHTYNGYHDSPYMLISTPYISTYYPMPEYYFYPKPAPIVTQPEPSYPSHWISLEGDTDVNYLEPKPYPEESDAEMFIDAYPQPYTLPLSSNTEIEYIYEPQSQSNPEETSIDSSDQSLGEFETFDPTLDPFIAGNSEDIFIEESEEPNVYQHFPTTPVPTEQIENTETIISPFKPEESSGAANTTTVEQSQGTNYEHQSPVQNDETSPYHKPISINEMDEMEELEELEEIEEYIHPSLRPDVISWEEASSEEVQSGGETSEGETPEVETSLSEAELYYNQRSKPIPSHWVSLQGDTEVNYLNPKPAQDPDAEILPSHHS